MGSVEALRANNNIEIRILSPNPKIQNLRSDEDLMITYPNQKVIQVKSVPHNGKDKSQTYGCINIEASNKAARVLKPNAYRMYVRIVLNQDGHEFALSPKAMREDIGISQAGYETAVKNLIDTGYLVQIRSGSNKYVFYENPPENVVVPAPVYIPPITTIPMVNTPIIEVDIPQNLGGCTPEDSGEIVQDTTHNIDNKESNNYPSGKKRLSYKERIEKRIQDGWKEMEEREQRRIEQIRNDFQSNYRRLMNKAIETGFYSSVKYDLIIKKYLADNPEPDNLRKAGDKYGRWIRGWDEQKQEPIIAYSFTYLEPKMMKQEIDAIPKSYYLPKKATTTD